MTDRQYELCKIILKKKNLNAVLSSAKLGDYMDLENAMPRKSLDYSDYMMNEHTEVILEGHILEAYEERKRDRLNHSFATTLSIIGAVTGIIGAITGIIALFNS